MIFFAAIALILAASSEVLHEELQDILGELRLIQGSKCSCADPKLCERVRGQREKEVSMDDDLMEIPFDSNHFFNRLQLFGFIFPVGHLSGRP